MAAAKTPVTLVTGYLGSGKTTLVNRILMAKNERPEMGKIAVIVNEFGAIGIDGTLIAEVAGEGKVIELEGGCLCCVVTGEFRATLDALPAGEFDHIIIETSGAVDPTSVIRLFWGAPELTACYRLDGVVCLLDARAFVATAKADPIAWLQASVADVQLITKGHGISRAELDVVRAGLVALNPSAVIVEYDFGTEGNSAENRLDFPLDRIFGIDAYRKPQLFTRMPLGNDRSVSHGGLSSVSASWEGKVSAKELQAFFRTLVAVNAVDAGFAEQVVRTKALVHVQGEERPWLIQGVQTWLERGSAPKSYKGPSRLVVLGRDLDTVRLGQAIDRLRATAQVS